MLKYYLNADGESIAEITPGSEIISRPDEMLEIMTEAGYNGCIGLIVHDKSLHRDFFDLKTGVAGEILQKFSNYRMKLAVIGDFSVFKSKSLKDFIRESNSRGTICFVDSIEKALLCMHL